LNYLTLVPARLRGEARYADLDEATLRVVPAVAGVLVVVSTALLVPVVGFGPATLAALFAAVSPAMVYYSRYYIQEPLLVAFSFLALVSVCRYLRSPRAGWAMVAGISIGLMAATKETWVISCGAMAGALALAWAFAGNRDERLTAAGSRRAAVHWAGAALSAIAVAGVFYSSFFSHPRGIIDALSAYSTYLTRAGGGPSHVHAWHYYLGLLLFSRQDGGPAWTEASILVLALGGLLAVFARGGLPGVARRPLVFLGSYAVLMLVAYSAIPYKTPWCVLGFLDAAVLLAGVGAARLLAAAPGPRHGLFIGACLVAAVAHLGWLAWLGRYRFSSDPKNPWVYAHTGTGVFEVMRRVDALARTHPDASAMPIEVISGQNLWPLPWYLRRFSAVRWETAPVNDGVHGALILTTPDMEPAIVRKLYDWRRPGDRELYMSVFDAPVELRPQVEVRGYAAKSLWDGTVVR
jgi:uncharacterized protein (TIGR03663 family)